MIVLPLTKVGKRIPSHVSVAGSDSGLDHDSFVICEHVRCVSRERLSRQIGHAPPAVMDQVSRMLRVLLEL